MANWLKRFLERKERHPSGRGPQIHGGLDYEGEYQTYREKGLRELAQRRAKDAVEALGRAALLRPNDPVAHFNLGRALQLAGKTEAARQAYLRALDLDPELAPVRNALLTLPSLPPSREDFHVGQRIKAEDGGFTCRVLEVRKGGFGVVYVVVEEEYSHRWALKTFQSRFLWSDADRKRFDREALTWLMLHRHPHIVTAKGLIRVEGLPCLWLSYHPYSLAEALKRSPLPIWLAIKLALQFCDGMSYANQKVGIVHRDIKPSNCLLTESLEVLKITDFGLARAFDEIQARRLDLSDYDPTVTSQFTTAAGTPQYMAPEQFQPGALLDTRTDIYSFGITFYEMLTKDLPPVGFLAHSHIEKCAESYKHDPGLYGKKKRAGISEAEAADHGDRVPSVPHVLKRIILQCVAFDPHERPNDFGELRNQLAIAYEQLMGRPVWWEPNPKALEMNYRDWNDKGLSLANLGYLHEACTCFERALALGGDDAIGWANYGGCLSRLGRFNEALSCFDKGLKIDSNLPGLWLNKAVALDFLGRLEEARTCYERAVQLDPENDIIWMNLGINLAEGGNVELALNCYSRSLGINPENCDAWYRKALALSKLKRYEEALASCDQGLAIQPRHANLWNARACGLQKLKRLEEALLASNRALEIEENYAHLWQTKGSILQDLRRPMEAEECLKRARTLGDRQKAPTRIDLRAPSE